MNIWRLVFVTYDTFIQHLKFYFRNITLNQSLFQFINFLLLITTYLVYENFSELEIVSCRKFYLNQRVFLCKGKVTNFRKTVCPPKKLNLFTEVI